MAFGPASKEEHLAPHLFGLPPELLLKILSKLTYYDLKRAAAVCKDLKTVIDGSDFDDDLFRIKGSVNAAPPHTREILLHPVLKEGDWANMILPSVHTDKEPLKLHDIVNSENATSPAVSKLYLKAGPNHCIHNSNGDPVSIEQVYKVVEPGWKKLLPGLYRFPLNPTYRDEVPDGYVWSWDLTRNIADNCIVLTGGL